MQAGQSPRLFLFPATVSAYDGGGTHVDEFMEQQMIAFHETAPNPQFVRQPWLDLCGTWKFRYDDGNTGLQEGWHNQRFDSEIRDILVPFPPESKLSGIDDQSFHPVVWYQRSLPVATAEMLERTLIRFGAVDFDATVWINGVLVGQHTGGSSPFTVDVATAWLQTLTEPTMTLRVFDDPQDKEQPRGKQAWTEQHADIWYKRTTGIWQPVWIEYAPAVHIDYVRWMYDAETASVKFDLELNQSPQTAETVTVMIESPDGEALTTEITVDTRVATGEIDLAAWKRSESMDHLQWSPTSPVLLPTRISTRSGDSVDGYIGLRTIELDRSGFRINGDPEYLRFVLSQGYFPESCYAAPSAEAIRREVELTLALGFNGARTHQKAEDPRYLYWADKLGLLIWGEIGAAYTWSDRSFALLANEWRELVRRDINHPSIIAWVPFNESWGIDGISESEHQRDGVRSIYALTNSLDGTRPVIGNDGWEHTVTDIFSLHDYHWDESELRKRYGSGRTNEEIAATYDVANKTATAGDVAGLNDLPLMITEYGGVSFAPSDNADWYGYGRVNNDDQFVEKYRDLTRALHDSNDVVGICYTQLTDTEQETNGLLTEDRTPKIDLATLSAITRGERS